MANVNVVNQLPPRVPLDLKLDTNKLNPTQRQIFAFARFALDFACVDASNIRPATRSVKARFSKIAPKSYAKNERLSSSGTHSI